MQHKAPNCWQCFTGGHGSGGQRVHWVQSQCRQSTKKKVTILNFNPVLISSQQTCLSFCCFKWKMLFLSYIFFCFTGVNVLCIRSCNFYQSLFFIAIPSRRNSGLITKASLERKLTPNMFVQKVSVFFFFNKLINWKNTTSLMLKKLSYRRP